MKRTTQEINELIENIRSGHPPKLPERVREQHYYDPALPNFYIRLLNTGVASWVVQWKRLGRQKKITLGDVLVLDRPVAIKAARELLAKMTLGLLDPHEARREQMRANKTTFATQVPLFLERKKNAGEIKPSTAKAWNSYLTGYYLNTLHNLPVVEITDDQIQPRIDLIADHSGNAAAATCYDVLRAFFKWLIEKTGNLPDGHRNPMDRVQAPKVNRSRARVLSDDEIRLIWNTCDAWEAKAIQQHQLFETTGKLPRGGLGAVNDPEAPRAIKLLFLTGCRAQEIGSLEWSEVDLDNAELFIPGARRKSRQSKEQEMDLCVPLADWAVQILRDSARRPNDRTHVFAPHKHRWQGPRSIPGVDLSGANRRVDERIVKAGGIAPPDWHIHDIRRTFRTRLSRLKVTMDVAERLVGHVGHRKQIVRTYDKYEYWPEMREAIAKLETHLRAVIDGTAEKIAYPRFSERKKENPA
jgi:integrase